MASERVLYSLQLSVSKVPEAKHDAEEVGQHGHGWLNTRRSQQLLGLCTQRCCIKHSDWLRRLGGRKTRAAASVRKRNSPQNVVLNQGSRLRGAVWQLHF